MTAEDLRKLYHYNYWATKKLFSVIEQLSQEEFTREVAGSYGSVRNTLVHVLSTEWGWLSRSGGKNRPAKLQPKDFPDFQALRNTWNEVEKYMMDFLGTIEDEDIKEWVTYNGKEEKRSMPRGELLLHSIIHGAHHRGQVAVLIRELGYTPGNFDLLFYSAEQHDVPAW